MALAVTIFGINERASPGIFLYAYLRHVRGPGDYPPPLGSRDATDDTITRRKLDGSEAEIAIWDKLYSDIESATALTELQMGRFAIPVESPIEPKKLIEGQPFGPIIIVEHSDRIRTCGTGLVRASGIAMKDGVARIKRHLESFMEVGDIAASLLAIFRIVAEESGLARVYAERRRLSCVELFARNDASLSGNGPLFSATLEKPDFRNKTPTRRVLLRRGAAPIGTPYRLHVALSNYDELLDELLLDIAADVPELVVETAIHVTDVDLSVFHPNGQLADRIRGAFVQDMKFSLTATGRRDALPDVFKGAPESADLKNRPRVSTVAFSGPAIRDRSGGLDVLRQNVNNAGMLTGADKWAPNNRWFRSSGKHQIEVIRWMKAKLEEPGVISAFIVDPYLESEAFRRIIIRQGNEAISLAVLVSAGRADSDGEDVDVAATGSNLDKLVATAEEFSAQLCGRISVYQVKRGDGSRQAFHDRYLCTLDQRGIPTVYMLSNSLSKAAGDWPFAISELDRISSWRVHAYIKGLLDGRDGNRAISTSLLWKTSEPGNAAASPLAATELQPVPPDQAWKLAANRFLDELRQVTFDGTTDEARVEVPINRLLASWDADTDVIALTDKVFEIVINRHNVAVFASSMFAAGTAQQARVSQRLDELLLKNFVDGLPRQDRSQPGQLPFHDRQAYLEHVARTITRLPSPTDYVRRELNAVVTHIVVRLEAQRSDQTLCFEQLESATCAIAVVLDVALHAENAELRFRGGMATDYIHLMGRLARAEIAATRFTIDEHMRDPWRADFLLATQKIAAARQILGEDLAAPIQRFLDDPLVIPAFKDAITAGVSKLAAT